MLRSGRHSDVTFAAEFHSWSAAPAPEFHKTSFRKLEYHSPREGESQQACKQLLAGSGGRVAACRQRRADAPRPPARNKDAGGTPALPGGASPFYHSPLEGESQRLLRWGRAYKQRPMARSCAPSRARTSQPTGEGRCGAGRHRHPRAAAPCTGDAALAQPPDRSFCMRGRLAGGKR